MNLPCDIDAGAFQPVSAPDYLPQPQLQALQLQRLQAIIGRAYERVELFRARCAESNVAPADLKSLADIARFPFTVKTDLRDTYPFGMFASDMGDIVRLHASSGTTGKPIVVAYTDEDIKVWASVMQRTFCCAGLHRGDIIQNAYGYGLFTGGLGAHYGAEALGATVIPISGGNTERQLMIMKDFGSNAICCTPSYFLHIIEQAPKLGINLKELPLRVGVFGAEPWTMEMGRYMEREAGVKCIDIYGLSEIIGPGVASMCLAQEGLHIFEDHFYPEIIDPETLAVLPDGAEGELVLTTLSKRAMPMIRYRTRDITRLIPERCACGRTIRRMERIGRRSDDMFIIRGVNVFPSQIETGLLTVEEALPHYQIILTRSGGLDQINVEVEVTPEAFSDRIAQMQELQKKIAHAIEAIIQIRVNVRLMEPNSLPRSEGKAKRLLDRRNEGM